MVRRTIFFAGFLRKKPWSALLGGANLETLNRTTFKAMGHSK